MPLPKRIKTPRLALRAPEARDTAAVFCLGADVRVTRHLAWPTFSTHAHASDFLDAMHDGWVAGDDFCYLIEYSGAVVGMVSIQPDKAAEIGFLLAPDYQRLGLASEAVNAVVRAAAHIGGLDQLWAACVVDNPAPARVLERAGFYYHGRRKAFARCPNRATDRCFDAFVYTRVVEANAVRESVARPSDC